MLAPCNQLSPLASLGWLAKGYSDFKQVAKISLIYGLMVALVSFLITWVAYTAHSIVLAIALVAGFFFMGPIIAIGWYSLSRQLSNQIKPNWLDSLHDSKKSLSHVMILSLMFLIVFLIWARAATMIHIFFPPSSAMQIGDWYLFVGVGSLIGAIFASIVFCVGAFSIPMLMDREVDTVTAVITSINAVLNNKLAMLVWASLIGVLTVIGILTLYLGFIVIIPIIGHATWHAYQETIDSDAWEFGENSGESEPEAHVSE